MMNAESSLWVVAMLGLGVVGYSDHSVTGLGRPQHQ